MSYRERFIHSEIDRARADVMSVVHCHTPSLLPFADTDVPMVARAVYLDVNARIQLQAAQIGGHPTYVDPQEAKLRMADPNEYSRAWELWKRKLSTK